MTERFVFPFFLSLRRRGVRETFKTVWKLWVEGRLPICRNCVLSDATIWPGEKVCEICDDFDGCKRTWL